MSLTIRASDTARSFLQIWTFDYKLNYLSMLKTSLAEPIRRLDFLPETKRLVVVAEKEVQLWSLNELEFTCKEKAGGRWSLVGRSTYKPTRLDQILAPPRDGLTAKTALRCGETLCVVWCRETLGNEVP